MQSLAASGIAPYYWSSQDKAEADFVFQDRQGMYSVGSKVSRQRAL